MADIRDGLTRVVAFARKEIVDVLRQPRLIVTMILGPFLILALFGAGYRQESAPLRTVFVASGDGEFTAELERRVGDFQGQIEFLGTVDSRSEALSLVRTGAADVAVIVPEEPVGTIRNGDRATFVVLHDQLDPFEQATIGLVAETTVDLVNRRVLEQVVEEGQKESGELEQLVPAALDSARGYRAAIEAGDTAEARVLRRELAQRLEVVEQRWGSTEVLIDNIRDDFTPESSRGIVVGEELDALLTELEDLEATDVDRPLDSELATAQRIENGVEVLSEGIDDFRQVPAEILVSPFAADTEVVGSPDLDITDFYAPGVIALLLQHLGITFAGLSIVREQVLGTPELFRVSPTHPGQILAGKYIGYLATSILVATALSALMFLAFGVPLLGSLWSYAAVLGLLTLASVGIGFVVSAAVSSDTQAVNVSMIILLLSIFFSGFFLSLDRLVDWVRAVSWALPITHAIDALRNTMFRGEAVDVRTLVALGGGSVVFFAAALFLMRRRLRTA